MNLTERLTALKKAWKIWISSPGSRSITFSAVEPTSTRMTGGPKIRLGWWALVYLALWTLMALAFAGQHYLTSAKLGVPVGWRESIGGALADWYVFAVLALAAIHFARRFNLAGSHWRLRLVLHLVAGAVFSWPSCFICAARSNRSARC